MSIAILETTEIIFQIKVLYLCSCVSLMSYLPWTLNMHTMPFWVINSICRKHIKWNSRGSCSKTACAPSYGLSVTLCLAIIFGKVFSHLINFFICFTKWSKTQGNITLIFTFVNCNNHEDLAIMSICSHIVYFLGQMEHLWQVKLSGITGSQGATGATEVNHFFSGG